MIFLELVLQNFGPYAGTHTIDLSPQYQDQNRPIILFGGMNGEGKTTLLDAIRLVLYGQRAQCSTRGNLSYSDFLNQSVNNQTPPQEKTRIELLVEHARNDQWVRLRVVRSWQKHPKEVKEHLGILEGDWPDTALANTWNEYIENLLPMGISNLFLFDGEQVKELAESDQTPSLLIDAIESLLGLELAQRLSLDLDVLASRKRKALATASELLTLDEIETKLNTYTETKAILIDELNDKKRQLKTSEAQYQEAYNKFHFEGGKLAVERSRLESILQQLQEAYSNKRKELAEVASGILPLGLIRDILTQACKQSEEELQQQRLWIAKTIILDRDAQLLEYMRDSLSVEKDILERVTFFLAEHNRSLDAPHQPPVLKIQEEEAQYLVNITEYQLSGEINKALNLVEELKNVQEAIEAKEKELSMAASPEKLLMLEEILRKAQQNLVEWQTACEIQTQKIEEVNKAIGKAKQELNKYSEQTLDRHNDEHIIQSISKVQSTLKLFKEKLTLKKLNKLEMQVTECFRYLLRKNDLAHRIVVNSKTFNLSLYDPQGNIVPKHRLSAGEKQLLAVAFLWGLARVSGRQLPVAIDTPLGRLDSEHRRNLVERYFPFASHQVLLFSTDTEIGEKEVEMLRSQNAISKQYLLKYDNEKRYTSIEPGYFW